MKCLLNHYNHSLWQALCLFSIFFSVNAIAQSCIVPEDRQYKTAGSYPGSTASESCSSWASASGPGYTGTANGSTCERYNNGTPWGSAAITYTSLGCPSGSTLNGEGQCQLDTCVDCPNEGTFSGAGSATGSASTSCNGSCELSSGGDCLNSFDPITQQVTNTWCSGWTFTGQSCTENTHSGGNPTDPTNTNPSSPSDCPPQTGFAEVNGVSMCLPGGSSYTGGTTTTTDNITGDTTTTTNVTTINSDGSSSTTTNVTTVNGSGTVTGDQTTVTEGGKIGDGKEKQEIDLGDAPQMSQELPTDENFEISSVPLFNLSTDIFGATASCPAPIAFTAMGIDFEIDLQPLCDLAPMIRGIILLLASITSIRLLVTD